MKEMKIFFSLCYAHEKTIRFFIFISLLFFRWKKKRIWFWFGMTFVTWSVEFYNFNFNKNLDFCYCKQILSFNKWLFLNFSIQYLFYWNISSFHFCCCWILKWFFYLFSLSLNAIFTNGVNRTNYMRWIPKWKFIEKRNKAFNLYFASFDGKLISFFEFNWIHLTSINLWSYNNDLQFHSIF